METRTTLQQTLTQIEKWENEQKDLWFWEKLGSSARSNFATVQGATTGIGGFFTLAVDIPLLESFSELTSIAQPSKMLPKLV